MTRRPDRSRRRPGFERRCLQRLARRRRRPDLPASAASLAAARRRPCHVGEHQRETSLAPGSAKRKRWRSGGTGSRSTCRRRAIDAARGTASDMKHILAEEHATAMRMSMNFTVKAWPPQGAVVRARTWRDAGPELGSVAAGSRRSGPCARRRTSGARAADRHRTSPASAPRRRPAEEDRRLKRLVRDGRPPRRRRPHAGRQVVGRRPSRPIVVR